MKAKAWIGSDTTIVTDSVKVVAVDRWPVGRRRRTSAIELPCSLQNDQNGARYGQAVRNTTLFVQAAPVRRRWRTSPERVA